MSVIKWTLATGILCLFVWVLLKFNAPMTMGEYEYVLRVRWQDCIDGCMFRICPSVKPGEFQGRTHPNNARAAFKNAKSTNNLYCFECLNECQIVFSFEL